MNGSERAALTASLTPPTQKQVVPCLKPVVDDPWKYPDACAAVDARSGGACECGQGCGLRANVHHHVSGRGVTNPHHPDNLLHLNDACHRRIHDHPVESYANGTMRRRVR